MSNEQESGFFESLLMIAGAIVGGIQGYEASGFLGMVIGGLILGAIGAAIGKFTDGLIRFVLFVFILLINTAIRQFVFQFIRELFAS